MKEPENVTPWLASSGYPDDPGRVHFTPHTFVRYEDVPAAQLLPPGPEGSPKGLTPGKALVFQCNVTGAERRFGME